MNIKWSSKNLRKLVEESGLTYDQITAETGLGRSTIVNAILERYSPSADTLITLADYFAVPLDYLTGRLSLKMIKEVEENFKLNFYILRKETYETLMLKKPSTFLGVIPEGYEPIWPYNLLNDIFDKEITEPMCLDQEEGLMLALDSLGQRYKDILLSIYRDGKSLVSIAEEYDITAERIRQIRIRCIRKMRYPQMLAMIADGIEGSHKMDEELFYISEKRKRLLSSREELIEMEKTEDPTDMSAYYNHYKAKFYDVLDNGLPVRVINALVREKIDTIYDIEEAFRTKKIFKIRNIGTVSIRNLIGYMKKAGYNVECNKYIPAAVVE